MPPFLAEVGAPDAHALKEFLEVAFYLVGGATAVVLLVNQFRTPKQEILNSPLEVRQRPGVATDEELKQLHGRLERERAEVDAKIEGVRADAERRLDKLETKIDANTAISSEMRGVVGQMNQTLSRVENSVTHFLQQQAGRHEPTRS